MIGWAFIDIRRVIASVSEAIIRRPGLRAGTYTARSSLSAGWRGLSSLLTPGVMGPGAEAGTTMSPSCEQRSDEAIHSSSLPQDGLLRREGLLAMTLR